MSEKHNPVGPNDSRKPNKPDVAAIRNYVAVARGQDLVVIRVVGNGDMLNAPALQEFIEEQRKAGFNNFVFDMERCKGLDSTFMGVMVGVHTAPEPESNPLDFSRSADPKTPTPEEALKAYQQSYDSTTAAHPHRQTSVNTVVSAVNVTKEVRELMAMLGVDKFVNMRGSCDLSKLETTVLPEKNIASADRHRLILKAHEKLVEIDERNRVQFGEFLKQLAAELSK